MSADDPRVATAPAPAVRWLMGLLCVGTALSPLNTKVAGATWLVLCLLAAWLGFGPSRPRPSGLQAAAMPWLMACVVAMALWTGLSWIWNEPCCSLTADLGSGLRLMLAAAASYVVARHELGSPGNTRRLLVAISLACLFALVLALAKGRDLPSHPIPWAVAISFLVCLLLPQAFSRNEARPSRWAWGLGAAFGIAAVILSQSRGAYGIVAWALVLAWLGLRHRGKLPTRKLLAASLALAALLVLAARLPSDPLRLREGWTDLKTAAQSRDYNSSLGARVFLFQMAWQGFQESPWTGLGATERLRRIRHAGDQLPPAERARLEHVRQLGHAHNQYLHNAMDGGLLGLAGLLALLTGMAVAARRLARLSPIAGQQMAGLLVMHAAAGLSNVNFAHNYYAVMLSLCIALVLLGAGSAPPPRPETDHSQG